MVLYTRACVGPTTKTSDGISIICLFRLILQAKYFVLFYLWYSSCFEVKCWIHTFPKRCSHIAMWILILLIIEVVMLILFQPACFSSSGSNHFSICKINYKFSQRCLFRSSQVVFVFPHPPTLFFKDSFILTKYPFIHVKSLHSFQSMFWSGDPSWRCSRASSSSSFVFFLLRWIQFKLSVLIIFLSSCQMFLMLVHLSFTHLLLFICSRVLKISQKICVSILNPFKLFWGSYLIQAI